jgi:hypothetical protein
VAPTCKKCGQPHFNFVACQVAASEREQAEKGRVIPRYVSPLPEGFKEWKPSGVPTWGQTSLSKVSEKA